MVRAVDDKATNVVSAPWRIEAAEDITLPWLEAVVHAGGYKTVRLQAFSLLPIGAGNVSDTFRVDLGLAPDSGASPASVVVKLHPHQTGAYLHGRNSGAYRCEGGAYNMFREHGAPCRVPAALWVNSGDEFFNLVMEDARAAIPGDQCRGATSVEAAAVIYQLACLHRRYRYDSPGAGPAWAIKMSDHADYWVARVGEGIALASQRFANALHDSAQAIIAQSLSAARHWHNRSYQHYALTHGDPRVDNILFDEKHGEPEAILIDWQVCGVRNPLHDVGYFLSGSMSIDDRQKYERHLLEVYAEYRGAGCSSGEILDEYRVQLVSGLLTTLAAVAVLPDNPSVNQLLLTLLERNCAAVLDWQSFDVINL